MSVMMCNRGNCENIMCNRYSRTYGYICDSCFAELLQTTLTIKDFMRTDELEKPKPYYEEWELKEEFPLLWQEQIEEK